MIKKELTRAFSLKLKKEKALYNFESSYCKHGSYAKERESELGLLKLK